MTLPENFTDTGTRTVPDKWWRDLNDEALNDLVNRALDDNFTLKQAWNRLAEARAAVVEAEADLFPVLDVTATGEVERENTESTEQTRDAANFRGVASYEVDLWGRIESSVEAAKFASKARRSDVRAAAISLSAEVASTWYQLVEQYAQLGVVENQIKTNRRLYRIVLNRYEFGQARAADVLRQQRLLESTREQKSDIESRIRVLEHSLSILLGQPPQKKVTSRRESFPEVPSLPETGVPGDLINRRPDVRADFFELMQADRQVAEAVADQYPRLTITATTSTSGGNGVDIFDNWLHSLAAELAIPLIDAEEREARVVQQKAVLAQRLNQYGQTVIESLQEVEDVLIQEKKQREQLSSIDKQLQLAGRTVDLLRQQYINGTSDFLDVLDSLRNEQRLQRDLLRARRQTIEFRIQLYRSLAGGWTLEPPEKGFEYLNINNIRKSLWRDFDE